MKNHDATIRKVQFLPNSTILASGGGGDGRIYMTDCINNQVVKYLDPGHLGFGLKASLYRYSSLYRYILTDKKNEMSSRDHKKMPNPMS